MSRARCDLISDDDVPESSSSDKAPVRTSHLTCRIFDARRANRSTSRPRFNGAPIYEQPERSRAINRSMRMIRHAAGRRIFGESSGCTMRCCASIRIIRATVQTPDPLKPIQLAARPARRRPIEPSIMKSSEYATSASSRGRGGGMPSKAQFQAARPRKEGKDPTG
jgi:hypothetical protein